ncbi:hypothetical protein K504DRAFT_534232 [Pleomassaria siparia CBS 279.74]|uniref:Rhodopsin domain-containing protein n=1 Tax=Pleomassaria siparia CBS 279.74 TaxID=1314801 RepID=A0A6G1K742_9PLEO|nr:hypothetical protein K504DRAFT_534232 [Pleomassaria siparia CBS 279.74]
MESLGSDEYPREAPSARGGIILVSLYSWICITIGVAIARFVVGSIHKVHLDFDDAMVLVGSIACTGATIGSRYAVHAGLGEHFEQLSPVNTTRYFKAAYTAQLLQLATIACGKLSSAFLLGRVAPQSTRERVVLFGSVVLWTAYSMLTLAFQCGLPRPWEYSPQKCGHGGPLISIIVLNMVSDILLTAWILPVLQPLDIDKARRRTVSMLFGTRAVIPLVCIAQVWGALKAGRGDDPTWDGFELAFFTQAVTSLSLIVASLPRIKRFIGSGGMNNLRIHDIELPLATRVPSDGGGSLQLVPSSANKFMTTIESGCGRTTCKSRAQNDWQKSVSTGSRQEDQNSTSSLFDHRGMMLQQEVAVKVEDNYHDHDQPH